MGGVQVMATEPRISFPHRGWVRFSWRSGISPLVVQALALLEPVPGVSVTPHRVDVPCTAWMLEAFDAFLVAASCEEQFASRRDAFVIRDRDWQGWASDLYPWWASDLYPWQERAARKAVESNGLLLADEMGLGKTRSAIAAVQEQSCGKSPNVIVAPGFTRSVWASELVAMGALAREEDLCVLRTLDMNHGSWRKDARWIFVHYDIVHAWASRLALARPNAVILDEAHWLKNGRARRTGGARVVAGRARFRVLLTGTPMDNAVGELHSLLELLTGTGTWGSNVAFRRRYAGAIFDGWGYRDRRPTFVAELRTRMEPWYLRRTEVDLPAGSLPALRRERLVAEMATDRREEHAALLEGRDLEALVAAVLEGRAGEDTIALLGRLRHVTSQAKRATTLAYVQNLLEQGESVVLFSWERATAEWFAQQLDRHDSAPWGVALHGGVPQALRDEYIAQFQEGLYVGAARGTYLAATYGVLREGVTLTRARQVVLHDLDWKFSTMLQAEKRVHRIGQRAACVSTWALAEDSFDVVLAKLLLRKASWLEETLGIEAPVDAAAELDLRTLAPDESAVMADWARAQLARWVR